MPQRTLCKLQPEIQTLPAEKINKFVEQLYLAKSFCCKRNPINGDLLYTLNFGDGKIIFAEDVNEVHYILRKFNEEYVNYALIETNLFKTDYMIVGDSGNYLKMKDGSVVLRITYYNY